MDSTHINLSVCEEKLQYLTEAIRKMKTVQSNLNDIHTALSRESNPETYTAVRTALERTYTELGSRIGTAETMESALKQVIATYRQAENKLLQDALERAKKLEELLTPVHAALDFMGLIPGAGALFDGANALCYLTEGNSKDALWAGIGAIPLGGDAAKAIKDAAKVADLAKDAKKTDKVLEAAEAAEKAAEKAKNAAKIGKNAEAVAEGGSKSIDNALPNVEKATINPKKIVEYALNSNHPVGGNKAKVFESALGYNQLNADDLMKQIYEKLPSSDSILGKIDEYGQRYTIDLPITGPNGNTVNVRTGWIIRMGSDTPELVTIYVKN